MTRITQMYHDILITTDGTDGTTAAVEHGLEVAERDGATVHLLYVRDDVVRRALFSMQSHDRVAIEERARAEQAIRDVESVATAYDVEVVSAIRGCPPYVFRDQSHQTIIHYADRNDIDLIVMGMQERTGIRRLVKGNVARRVVMNTDVPVLTSRIPLPEMGERDVCRPPDPTPETG